MSVVAAIALAVLIALCAPARLSDPAGSAHAARSVALLGHSARGRPGAPEYPGPRPLSEPETRLIRGLIRHTQPDVTIWFHQPLALVRAWGRSVADAKRFAALAQLPFRRMPWLAGTAPNWQNHRFARGSSFVVELPPGPLAPARTQRLADAVLALAQRGGR